MSCSTKGPYVYDFAVKEKGDPSQIASNELIGFVDSSLAFVTGQVLFMTTQEYLHFAQVKLSDLETKESYFQIADTLGQFSLGVPESKYELEVSYPGSTSLKTKMEVQAGELRKLKIELGRGECINPIQHKSRKKLSPEELQEFYEKNYKDK